ncbi:phosphoesterase PA-phosphatase [Actinoplanes sp. NPDC049118]|uniref:phosphoesterase PA-phosphatase n=1 Tax=Actinoplanes sp. NPDC049118 TaxID=3155769 RepID=UPI0033D00018
MTATRTAEPAAAPRAAKLITDVLSPVVLVSVQLLLVPVHAAGMLPGLAWGAVAVAFVSAAPLAYILFRVRRRTLTDVHIGVREHRRLPLLVGLVTVLAGLALLAATGAPRELLALIAAIVVLAVATIAITGLWKISVHATVAMMTVGVLVALFGPWLWLTLPVVALIGWARVALADHTVPQVLAGAALGLCVAGAFVLAR